METKIVRKRKPNDLYFVLSLPTRNGNNPSFLLPLSPPVVLSLPTRNGNLLPSLPVFVLLLSF